MEFTAADLRLWRNRLGFTQAQAAELLGVTRNTYTRWEIGRLPLRPYLGAKCREIEEKDVSRFLKQIEDSIHSGARRAPKRFKL